MGMRENRTYSCQPPKLSWPPTATLQTPPPTHTHSPGLKKGAPCTPQPPSQLCSVCCKAGRRGLQFQFSDKVRVALRGWGFVHGWVW
jgi:hypothetical protein